MTEDDYGIDAIDATFIGLGAYLNEDEKIPEEEPEETNEFDEPIHTAIEDIQRMPRKIPLRPFEQHVQDSIDKLKRR